ncbi:hypothetical protein WNE31_18345, partial [Shimia sp. SDUM112013]
MPINVINGLVTTGQTLGVGDDLVVTQIGSLMSSGRAVSATHDEDVSVAIYGTVTAGDEALYFSGGGDSSSATIFVGETGVVRSFQDTAMLFYRDGVVIENNGAISSGDSPAILFATGVNGANIHNTGTISGGVDAHTISFAGNSTLTAVGTFRVTNSGIIRSDNNLVNGLYENMWVTNSGTMISTDDGVVLSGSTYTNSIWLLNSGQFLANDYAVYSTYGSDRITNLGEMAGNIYTSQGDDRVVNSGRIIGNISTGRNDDFVRNSGFVDGIVRLGEDGDEYRGYGGHVTEGIELGFGDDAAWVDQSGVEIDGGAGVDTVVTRAGTTVIDVEEVTVRGTEHVDVTVAQGASTVYGNIGDNHFMNHGADSVAFYGRSGDDRLEAGTSGDTLDGGAGNDMLIGGTGVDTMTGAAG